MYDEHSQARVEQNHVQFVHLFSQHQRDIKAYIRSLVPSAADADDVMQETSVILWEKFSEYEPGRDFGRWGCGIARMVVLRLRRKTANDRHWFNEELIQLLSSERQDKSASFFESRRDALRECVAALDPGQCRFLELRYGQNKSVEAISQDAGRPLSTIYRRFAKLRKLLYDCVSRKLEVANRL